MIGHVDGWEPKLKTGISICRGLDSFRNDGKGSEVANLGKSFESEASGMTSAFRRKSKCDSPSTGIATDSESSS